MSSDKNIWIKVKDDGFSINLTSGVRDVLWKDIEEINAYKVDLMNIDEIYFDIILAETCITITEELEGWSEFTEKLNTIFPTFDKEWFSKVAFPPFETNFITLFKR
jgi:hypothetical protein